MVKIKLLFILKVRKEWEMHIKMLMKEHKCKYLEDLVKVADAMPFPTDEGIVWVSRHGI